ncbi:protein cereblon-like [Leguminivora glycinivorella]|uniref:protein cereblon-like n=1 Tax=Leguminivora glycinivorella TaxID=1035111 RepID=UPI00200E001D|nr:protein cereblon-like [Leguminivora glycinivorella]
MEENVAESEQQELEPEPEEMALVGVEEGDAGLAVMAVDGGEAGAAAGADAGGDDEEEQEFDITLAATHSYMGGYLEQMGGRRTLEAGWRGLVAGMAHHSTVFPGETVPRLLAPEPLRDVILHERMFCLLCPDEAGMDVSGMGVLCEVLTGATDGSVVARAAHRVRMRQPHYRNGFAFRNMQMIEVEVLPELAPGDPMLPSRLPSLNPLRRVQDSSLQAVIRRMDAAPTPVPAFVWRMFDYRRLRARLTEHFATLDLADKMPHDPVSLSFWVASNLTLSARDRNALFEVDNALFRLKLALRFIDKSKALCCGSCGAELSRRSHMFAMSSDGVHANYTNFGGFMHDVVTVRTATETLLGPPSAEYSWFPGYTWRVAQCSACGTHVGWRFDAMKRKLRPAQFFALCRNLVMPRAERELSDDDTDAV